MIFKRRLYQELLQWKQSGYRKPLVIRGARQVGKSTLVRAFSKEYKSFVELNLERADDAKFFELGSVKDIINAISLRENKVFNSETLLFIDEIQEAPNAIKLLRFFYEDFPNLHVICAGSLLEFAMKNLSTFPVGRVQQMVLHPLDFEEFLIAKGNKNIVALFDELPLQDFSHEVILKQFHEYAIIGGMPEVVKIYIQNNSMIGLNQVYDDIWQAYKDDIEKYGKNDSERKILRHIVNTAPNETDRITMARFGHSNYKSREVGEAFQALQKSRLIQLIYPTISCQPPVQVDYKRKPRLQFLDSGLLNHALGIQFQLVGLNNLSDFYRGRIIQHLVFQQLQAQTISLDDGLHFWVREKTNSNAEVDLIYSCGKYLIPVEVKAGAQGRLRSLHQFVEQANHSFAIRVLSNKISIEKVTTPEGKAFTLLNLPYYLSTRIPQYAHWLINKA